MAPVNHVCGVDEEDLGPFLLGQLDDDRAAAVAEQVARCPSCREEVEQLRPVVTVLARSSPPPAVRSGPTVGRTGGQVGGRARRPGRRRRVALVAAAVVLLVGAAGAVTALPGRSDGGRTVVLAGAPGASASAVLRERRWGTAIELEVRGLDADATYGVWLERREGGRLPAGSFRPDGDGTFRLSLATALPLDDSRAVGVALLPGGRAADAVDVLTAPLR